MSDESQNRDVPFDAEPPQSPAPLIPPDRQPCPKCHSQMVEGWIPDVVSGSALYTHHKWQTGPPTIKKSKAFGLIESQIIVPPNPKKAIPLLAFRCVRCGFVELYARDVG